MFQYFTDIFSKGIWSDARESVDPEMVVLVKELKNLQKSSKASSTLSKYASSWKSRCAWSSSTLHIPEIPAKPLHVALFLTEMFLSCVEKGTGSSALESAVYAIRWAHRTAGLNSPTDHPVVQSTLEGAKRKLGRPVNPKEPISLELVETLCVNYASSSSLRHLRFLVILLLGYAGFLRVDELHSLRVGDISIVDDHMAISVRKRKNDQYREGHTVYIAKSGKVTCPVTTTGKLLDHLSGSSSETPLVRRIVKSKKTEHFHSTKGISEEFKTHVSPFAVNIQQLSMHSLKSGAASNLGCRSLDSDLIDRHAGWRCSYSKRRYIKYSKDDLLKVSKSLNL